MLCVFMPLRPHVDFHSVREFLEERDVCTCSTGCELLFPWLVNDFVSCALREPLPQRTQQGLALQEAKSAIIPFESYAAFFQANIRGEDLQGQGGGGRATRWRAHVARVTPQGSVVVAAECRVRGISEDVRRFYQRHKIPRDHRVVAKPVLEVYITSTAYLDGLFAPFRSINLLKAQSGRPCCNRCLVNFRN